MATLVIRDANETIRGRLKAQAAALGHSMEEEARRLLLQGLVTAECGSALRFGDAVRALFEPVGGVELPLVERELLRDPPDFSRLGGA